LAKPNAAYFSAAAIGRLVVHDITHGNLGYVLCAPLHEDFSKLTAIRKTQMLGNATM